jgi:hypothetical protein
MDWDHRSLGHQRGNREKLGLRVKKPSETTVAGGGKVPSGITEYVEVHWQDRETSCEAVVLPGEEDVLIGAYPLEGMGLISLGLIPRPSGA